jgi:hypothetical protein
MAMAAASSRLLWASRAAAYLRISTFPRAFSTGTPTTPVSGALVPRITAPRGWYGATLCRFARV